jgi:hypothetical protein
MHADEVDVDYMTRYPRPRPNAMTAKSTMPYLDFVAVASLVVACAAPLEVVELPVVLAVPLPVAVLSVVLAVADGVVEFPNEVCARTPPDVLFTDAEEVVEVALRLLLEALEPEPELPLQVPLDLMLCQSPVSSEYV